MSNTQNNEKPVEIKCVIVGDGKKFSKKNLKK
jgi:hypothetical protein